MYQISVSIIPEEDRQPFPALAAAKETLALNGPLRGALLTELSILWQRKAETPIVKIDPELLQQLAYLDGRAAALKDLLAGIFLCEPPAVISNAESDQNQE